MQKMKRSAEIAASGPHNPGVPLQRRSPATSDVIAASGQGVSLLSHPVTFTTPPGTYNPLARSPTPEQHISSPPQDIKLGALSRFMMMNGLGPYRDNKPKDSLSARQSQPPYHHTAVRFSATPEAANTSKIAKPEAKMASKLPKDDIRQGLPEEGDAENSSGVDSETDYEEEQGDKGDGDGVDEDDAQKDGDDDNDETSSPGSDNLEQEVEEGPSEAEKIEAVKETAAWKLIEEYQLKYYPQGLPRHIDCNDVWKYLNRFPSRVSSPGRHLFWQNIVNGARKSKMLQWRNPSQDTYIQAFREKGRLNSWIRPTAMMALKVINATSPSGKNELPKVLRQQVEALGLAWILEDPDSWQPGRFWEGARFDQRAWIALHVTTFGTQYNMPQIDMNPFFRSDYLCHKAAAPTSARRSVSASVPPPQPEKPVAFSNTARIPEVQQAISAPSSTGQLGPARPAREATVNSQATIQLAGNQGSRTTTPAATQRETSASIQQLVGSGRSSRQGSLGSRDGTDGDLTRINVAGTDNENETMLDAKPTIPNPPPENSNQAPVASLTPLPLVLAAVQNDLQCVRKTVEDLTRAKFAPKRKVNEAFGKVETRFKAVDAEFNAVNKRLKTAEDRWETAGPVIEDIQKRLQSLEEADSASNPAAEALRNQKIAAMKGKMANEKIISECKNAEDKLALAVTQIATLTSTLQATNTLNATLSSSLETANARIATLTGDLTAANGQIAALTANQGAMPLQVADLTAKLEAVTKAKAVVEDSNVALQNQLTESKSKNAAVSNENAILQVKSNAVKEERDMYRSKYRTYALQEFDLGELHEAILRRGGASAGESLGAASWGSASLGSGYKKFSPSVPGQTQRSNGYMLKTSISGSHSSFEHHGGSQRQNSGPIATSPSSETRAEMEKQQHRGREESRKGR